MALEIEAKLKVEAHDHIRRRLQALGADRRGVVHEVNHLFDQDACRLSRSGYGLRVRESTASDGSQARAAMTVKGPPQPGALKIRRETEVPVGSAAEAVALLEHLGYHLTVVFEKKRETWCWQDCTIELDEVPILGAFVEIEGPSEAAVRQVQAELELADCPTITRSYAAMLQAVCKSARVDPLNIRF